MRNSHTYSTGDLLCRGYWKVAVVTLIWGVVGTGMLLWCLSLVGLWLLEGCSGVSDFWCSGYWWVAVVSLICGVVVTGTLLWCL
jgi:hypothetical protein